MTVIEQRYEVTEKEFLAVVYAINNSRPYLYGREFILACDMSRFIGSPLRKTLSHDSFARDIDSRTTNSFFSTKIES